MKFSGKRTLVIYDSSYGDTAKVASIIALSLKGEGPVTIKHAKDVHRSDLEGISLLILGSPTQGGRATEDINEFISRLGSHELRGVRVATFDTGFAIHEHGLGLKLVMKTIGFAAGKMAKGLSDKGAVLIAEPEGFIVEDKDGPSTSGELTRAADWAQLLIAPAISHR